MAVYKYKFFLPCLLWNSSIHGLAQQTLSCELFLAGSPPETLLSKVDEHQNSTSYVLSLAADTEGLLVCANIPGNQKR